MLTVARAGFAYRGAAPVFSNLDFTLARGEVLCILGPNGVGKSTLLRCLAGLDTLGEGSVHLDGQAVTARASGLGRLIGFVPQSDRPAFAFDVRTNVELGRAPHLALTATPGAADARIVQQALDRLGIAHLAPRAYPELSGGERQLVLIARALAQRPALLIMDEPTSHLDFANQAGVLDLARSLADEGLAVIMTTHDPDHAFLIANHVLLLSRGRPALVGPPRAVVTETRLAETYGRAIRIVEAGGRVLSFPV